MKLKRKRVKLEHGIKENLPLFCSYVDAIKRVESSVPDYDLLQSTLYEGFAVIEAPSKLISGIIDYSVLKK